MNLKHLPADRIIKCEHPGRNPSSYRQELQAVHRTVSERWSTTANCMRKALRLGGRNPVHFLLSQDGGEEAVL